MTGDRFSDPAQELIDGRGQADAALMMRYDANKRSVLIAYLLWFFLGYFGVHRFYLGRVVSGLVLLLLWAIGAALSVIYVGYLILVIPTLWLLLDALLIPGMTRSYNNRLATRLTR
jgi:TM2 domain-containing membrane protein YozV